MTTHISPTCARSGCSAKLVKYDDYFDTRHKDDVEYICPDCSDTIYRDEPGFNDLVKANVSLWSQIRSNLEPEEDDDE